MIRAKTIMWQNNKRISTEVRGHQEDFPKEVMLVQEFEGEIFFLTCCVWGAFETCKGGRGEGDSYDLDDEDDCSTAIYDMFLPLVELIWCLGRWDIFFEFN